MSETRVMNIEFQEGNRDANTAPIVAGDASTPPFAFGTSGLYISYAWWRTLIRMTHVYRTKRILYYGALPRS